MKKRGAAGSVRRDLVRPGTTFVLGKGGTGKSVLSQGIAAMCAEAGRKTLLVSIGESLHATLPYSPVPTPTKYKFDAVDLDPRMAMDEYVQKVVRLRPLVERITGSEVYRKFFAAAPGLPELVLLGRIRAYSHEVDRHQALRFESIIVDCPSSGHGLLMLETPFAAHRAMPVGPFGNLAFHIMEWLKGETRIALVAIPEEMAVIEAIEFKEELLERTGLTPSLAFLNRMRQEELSAAAHLALLEVDAAPGSADRLLLDGANRVQRRTRIESFHQRRLTRGLGLAPMVVGELANCRPLTVAAELSGEGE